MFCIDPESTIPIYSQIRNGIVKEIAQGNLQEGDDLPSVWQLAQDLGVNHMTVNKAYTQLKQDKYIVTDRRVGAKVKVGLDEEILGDLEEAFMLLLAEARARGIDSCLLKEWIEGGIK